MTAKEAARKFEFIREIASGGFGSVYLAKVIHGDGFSRLVAIKLLHRKWSENDEIASRMRDEARLLGWLRHRNIVDVMDLTLIDGRCAVVMEFLDAVDARELIDHCVSTRTRIPIRCCLEVCAAAASALDAAYNRPPYAGEKPLRVIHRDIKPSNIMVDGQGQVKVLDFGVARAEFDAREAKTAELSFGSLEYMPPERLFFEPEAPSSDIYSLGATLYEMIALQKLGKAKLRQSEQERFFEERFEDLISHHQVPTEEAEDILHDLLRDMLSFDENERPTAADTVIRLRSFARQLEMENIEEWSERTVPGLLVTARAASVTTAESLVGRVVTEDVSGVMDDPAIEADGAGSLLPEGNDTAALLRGDGVPDDFREDIEGSEHSRGRDDERWSALKQATLASLTETGELGPRQVQAVRQVAGFITPGVGGDDDNDTVLIREMSSANLGDATVTAPGILMDDLPAMPLSLHTERTVVMKEVPPGRTEPPPPSHQSLPPPPATASRSGAAAGMFALVAMLLLGGLALLLLLMLVVGLTIGDVGGFNQPMVGEGTTAPTSQPVPAPRSAEPKPAPPEPVVVPDNATVFVSALSNTKAMVAQCGKQREKGTNQVVIANEGIGDCTVTVVSQDGKRRRAKVQGPDAREYQCFASSEDLCL